MSSAPRLPVTACVALAVVASATASFDRRVHPLDVARRLHGLSRSGLSLPLGFTYGPSGEIREAGSAVVLAMLGVKEVGAELRESVILSTEGWGIILGEVRSALAIPGIAGEFDRVAAALDLSPIALRKITDVPAPVLSHSD